MTTHLEYYSQAAAHGAGPRAARAAPAGLRAGRGAAGAERRRLAVPDQGAHRATPSCAATSTWQPTEPEYAAAHAARVRPQGTLCDSWRLLHGARAARAHLPPVRPHATAPSRSPATSSSSATRLKDRVRRIEVDGAHAGVGPPAGGGRDRLSGQPLCRPRGGRLGSPPSRGRQSWVSFPRRRGQSWVSFPGLRGQSWVSFPRRRESRASAFTRHWKMDTLGPRSLGGS